MANERLRAALLERGLTPAGLAAEVGVDHKTVERWIGGRTPYRRHRYAISTRLRVHEAYLWPDALPREQVANASASEIVAVYPHRSEVPRHVWTRLFDAAAHEIDVLVYAGLFLAEDAGLQRVLLKRAKHGVRMRFLVGAPDSAEVEGRSREEGVDGAIGPKIRSALASYQPLREADGIEFRFHRTVLYNSIYRAPAAQAPVWHLRKVPGGELVTTYIESFERVWSAATAEA